MTDRREIRHACTGVKVVRLCDRVKLVFAFIAKTFASEYEQGVKCKS